MSFRKFRHYSSVFFSSLHHIFFIQVIRLGLYAVSKAFAFIGIILICQEYLFVIVFVISSNIFLTKHIWRSEISNDEGLQFQLPAVVLGVSMTIWWRTKSTQKSKMQLVDFICWVVQRFRHFSSDFSSSLPPYFPGQSSLFTCCCESGHFHCVGLNFPWVSFFVNVCPKFPDDFFIYNYFMKIPFFCIGEALNLLMPAVALRVSMTMSWPAKTTQKSKIICVHFLDWVVQWFLQFSSDFFEFFNHTFFPVDHPWLLAVPKAVTFFGLVLICHDWVFVNVFRKCSDGLLDITFFMKIPICIGEGLKLHLPAVALPVSMTMSGPSKVHKKRKRCRLTP